MRLFIDVCGSRTVALGTMHTNAIEPKHLPRAYLSAKAKTPSDRTMRLAFSKEANVRYSLSRAIGTGQTEHGSP